MMIRVPEQFSPDLYCPNKLDRLVSAVAEVVIIPGYSKLYALLFVVIDIEWISLIF